MRFFVTEAQPVISCYRCGTMAECGPHRVDAWVTGTGDIHRIINGDLPNIPVGWSSNGWKGNRRDLRCPACTAPNSNREQQQ